MGLFSRAELPDLLTPLELPCISIYLSASINGINRNGINRKGETAQQQFCQTVHEIWQQLIHSSPCQDDLKIAAHFVETMQAIQPQVIDTLTSESVAIFYTPQFLRWYRLPGHLVKTARVSESFDLKPLLPFLFQGELFYVLAFGQSQVRLFQGSRYALQRVHLQELPGSLTEAMILNFEPPTRSKELISLRTVGRVHGSPSFSNSPIDDDVMAQEASLKQQMHQSCKRLAQQLDRFLEPQNAPLLLAGMPQLLSTYRTINPNPTMLNTQIAGNLDTMKLEDLHQQAWNRVQALVSSEREQALRQYEQAVQGGSASNHLGDIITKAINGKVKTLFISSTYQKWGKFNPYTWEVEVHCQQGFGDIDLTQFAVEQTLMHGGAVYVMQPEMLASCDSNPSSTGHKNAFETIAAILQP